MKRSQTSAVGRFVGLLLLGLAVGCGDHSAGPHAGDAVGATDSQTARAVVLTTFRPTADFARRIAGELVDVRCPVPAGEDPIFWQPSRDVLAQYRAADLVLVNGAEYEKWVATASLPSSRVVDTAAGFRDAWLVHAGSVTHSHGGAGAHTHEGTDGHTWLDPVLARQQAESIASALTRLLPEHASELLAGQRSLAFALDALDARWTSLAPRLRDCRVLASHPAYDYVARRYDVAIVNVLLDPQGAWDEQTAALVADALARAAPPDRPTLLLWESAPRIALADALRERFGITSVVVTPAENPSPDELGEGRDTLVLFAENLDRLAAALDAR